VKILHCCTVIEKLQTENGELIVHRIKKSTNKVTYTNSCSLATNELYRLECHTLVDISYIIFSTFIDIFYIQIEFLERTKEFETDHGLLFHSASS
jgi:hypothetical protein